MKLSGSDPAVCSPEAARELGSSSESAWIEVVLDSGGFSQKFSQIFSPIKDTRLQPLVHI